MVVATRAELSSPLRLALRRPSGRRVMLRSQLGPEAHARGAAVLTALTSKERSGVIVAKRARRAKLTSPSTWIASESQLGPVWSTCAWRAAMIDALSLQETSRMVVTIQRPEMHARGAVV